MFELPPPSDPNDPGSNWDDPPSRVFFEYLRISDFASEKCERNFSDPKTVDLKWWAMMVMNPIDKT